MGTRFWRPLSASNAPGVGSQDPTPCPLQLERRSRPPSLPQGSADGEACSCPTPRRMLAKKQERLYSVDDHIKLLGAELKKLRSAMPHKEYEANPRLPIVCVPRHHQGTVREPSRNP
eukprot:2509812-Alexandrium_andersonii.AAC.1